MREHGGAPGVARARLVRGHRPRPRRARAAVDRRHAARRAPAPALEAKSNPRSGSTRPEPRFAAATAAWTLRIWRPGGRMTRTMDKPFALADVRVLDLSRAISGPFVGRLLADLGADVIKVEPPEGDIARQFGIEKNGVTGLFLQQNAGKRNVCIDLKDGARSGAGVGAGRARRRRDRELSTRRARAARTRLGEALGVERAARDAVDHRLRQRGQRCEATGLCARDPRGVRLGGAAGRTARRRARGLGDELRGLDHEPARNGGAARGAAAPRPDGDRPTRRSVDARRVAGHRRLRALDPRRRRSRPDRRAARSGTRPAGR